MKHQKNLTSVMLDKVVCSDETLGDILNECSTIAQDDCVIYSIKRYDMFTNLDSNRNISTAHVNSIVQSMEKHGVLFTILYVNEKLQVIDGQHRLRALEIKKGVVNFIVRPKWGPDETTTLNATSEKWKLDDFTGSYAARDYEPYQRMKYLTEMSGISTSKIVKVFGDRSRYAGNKYKDGEFTLSQSKSNMMASRLAKMIQMKPYHPGWQSYNCMRSMDILMSHTEFDFGQLLIKLSKFPDETLLNSTTLGSVNAYLDKFIKVYNHHSRSGKFRLRFTDKVTNLPSDYKPQ
jgi:hypothetical protein